MYFDDAGHSTIRKPTRGSEIDGVMPLGAMQNNDQALVRSLGRHQIIVPATPPIPERNAWHSGRQ